MQQRELKLLADLAAALIGDRLPLPGEAITIDGARFDLRALHSAKQAAQLALTEEVANHGVLRA